jgi:hypothetical protein
MTFLRTSSTGVAVEGIATCIELAAPPGTLGIRRSFAQGYGQCSETAITGRCSSSGLIEVDESPQCAKRYQCEGTLSTDSVLIVAKDVVPAQRGPLLAVKPIRHKQR